MERNFWTLKLPLNVPLNPAALTSTAISSTEWLTNNQVKKLNLGVLAGDVHIRIFIEKHKEFIRKGADLFVDKKITLLEALTGTNYEFKHLDGKKYKVTF
jgi:DnaJ-class molecular chaperone